MAIKRPTFDKFLQTALQDPEVRTEYDALSTVFEMKRQMIALRKKAEVTQGQMADLLGTKKSNISRLKSLDSNVSPRLATVEDYTHTLGYSIKNPF